MSTITNKKYEIILEEALLEAKDCANYWLNKSIDCKIKSERKRADEAYIRYVTKIVTLEEIIKKAK